MITLTEQPNIDCIVPLSDAIQWCLRDDSFIISQGTNATVVIGVLSSNIPLAQGAIFTILGKTITVDNFITAGSFTGTTISGQGNTGTVLTAIQGLLDNCFFGQITTTLSPNGSLLFVDWNDVGELGDFINEDPLGDIFFSAVNGTDPEYTNEKLKARLYCHENGELNYVEGSEQKALPKVIDGKVQPICFKFNSVICLESKCPNFADGFVVSTSQQKKYCIRYQSTLDGTWIESDPIVVYNGVIPCDDPRDTSRFCRLGVSALNEYVKKCFCNNYAWMSYSLNLNCFFGSDNVSFGYQVTIQFPGTTIQAPIQPTDGIVCIPVGDGNIEEIYNIQIPNGTDYTVLLQTNIVVNGTTLGTFDLSEELTFRKGTECCEDEVEIYWQEPSGVFSTMCFSCLDEKSITSSGDKVCIGRLSGASYTDKLKRGKYSSFNKKSEISGKLKMESDFQDEQMFCDFLASDEYYMRTKDRQDNDIIVKIIPDFNSTRLYKKEESIEIIFGYTIADEKLTVNNA